MLFHLQVHYYFICWSNESFGWKIINYKSIHSFPWTVQAILFVNNFYIVIMERFPLVNWLFNTPYWFYLRKSANEKYVPNVCCYCLLNKWDNEKKKLACSYWNRSLRKAYLTEWRSLLILCLWQVSLVSLQEQRNYSLLR